MMYGAPKELRISWLFWGDTMNSPELYVSSEFRAFKYDKPMLDNFNIRPSQVQFLSFECTFVLLFKFSISTVPGDARLPS